MKLLNKVGPVLVLYILGIIVGNVFHPAGMAKIQDLLSSAMVPLAIPIMLFACTFSSGQTRSQLLALITGMVAMKNRSVLASGLAIGVVGYAAGTYLGFIISQIL